MGMPYLAVGLNIGWTAGGYCRAVLQDMDAVRDAKNQQHAVLDEHDTAVKLGLDPGDGKFELFTLGIVQACTWFVHQKIARTHGDGASDADAAIFAKGQGLDAACGLAFKSL